MLKLVWLWVPLMSLALILGCQRSPNQITIQVDRGEIFLATEASTVREVLDEAEVELGDLDRVSPDLNYRLKPVMTIEVIRVMEEREVQTNTLAYGQQRMSNEALKPGEQRLLQPGVNGVEEIVTRVVYENGVEVSRTQVSRGIVSEPVDEVIVVGQTSTLAPATFQGSIVYLSGGNAWVMKNSTDSRRPLTTQGDLDGRVFALSPDGQSLLYSRNLTASIEAPLNELWLADTLIVGEPPISTPIQGVLYAEWSPVVTQSLIAYSTGQRVAGQPGWRANNDLWLWDTTSDFDTARQIISPNTSSVYAWWGSEFAWSPNGRYVAFANASQVGLIDVVSQTQHILYEFAPYQSNSNWVWVPGISWSPNSQFLATVIHGPPMQNEAPEASPRFDLWVLSINGELQLALKNEVGMWSNPFWYAGGIAYGQAVTPLQSVSSRYRLHIMDWDGSNDQLRFPQREAPALDYPEMTAAQGKRDLLFVYRNNLHLLRENDVVPLQLTSDGQSQQARWTNSSELVTLRPISPTTRREE